MRLNGQAYRRAVEFVALNDEPTMTDAEEVHDQMTVVLIAEAFNVTQADVTTDVLAVRADYFNQEAS